MYRVPFWYGTTLHGQVIYYTAARLVQGGTTRGSVSRGAQKWILKKLGLPVSYAELTESRFSKGLHMHPATKMASASLLLKTANCQVP